MAFTDGCSGLRSMLVDADVKAPPSLDWFHIAMRLQHAEKTAGTLPVDTPERENARAVIVAEVLHWRVWHGKAKGASVTPERIRQVMPVFQGEGDRKRDPPSRRLWTALREIDRYLISQTPGWSTMPSAIVPACGSALRSRKGPPTSWSTAA